MAKGKTHKEGFDDKGKFATGNQAHSLRKNPGRKSKLPRFLEEFKSVIQQDHPVGYAIMFTDRELREMVNRRLRKKGYENDQVPESTFVRWKSCDWVSEADQAMGDEFKELYSEALEDQMSHLFRAMADDDEKRSWQRYAWIIERKKDEWNLRSKSMDETPDARQLVLRVKED